MNEIKINLSKPYKITNYKGYMDFNTNIKAQKLHLTTNLN